MTLKFSYYYLLLYVSVIITPVQSCGQVTDSNKEDVVKKFLALIYINDIDGIWKMFSPKVQANINSDLFKKNIADISNLIDTYGNPNLDSIKCKSIEDGLIEICIVEFSTHYDTAALQPKIRLMILFEQDNHKLEFTDFWVEKLKPQITENKTYKNFFKRNDIEFDFSISININKNENNNLELFFSANDSSMEVQTFENEIIEYLRSSEIEFIQDTNYVALDTQKTYISMNFVLKSKVYGRVHIRVNSTVGKSKLSDNNDDFLLITINDEKTFYLIKMKNPEFYNFLENIFNEEGI